MYESMSLLEQRLKQELANDGVIELRTTYLAITTDTLARLAFHTSLGLLDSSRQANYWEKTIKAVAFLTPPIKQFPWIIPVASKLPLGLLRIVVPDIARIIALRRVRDEL